MKPVRSTREHYDRLAELGNGWDDPPLLQSYMARWDGPAFYGMLGDLELTRFGGHLTLWGGDCSHAETTSSIPT